MCSTQGLVSMDEPSEKGPLWLFPPIAQHCTLHIMSAQGQLLNRGDGGIIEEPGKQKGRWLFGAPALPPLLTGWASVSLAKQWD